MSAVPVHMERRESQGGFVRRLGTAAVIGLVVYGAMQVASSQTEPDPAIEALWLQDLTAQVVIGVLAAGIALLVGRWAAGRDRRSRIRGVVGLGLGAVVLGPLVWWSAAPALLAAGAIILGNLTGVIERDDGSRAARSVALLAGLVGAATFTVLAVGILIRVI